MGLLGRRESPEQMLRNQKRTIDRAIRDIDRERSRMQTGEARTMNEIKRLVRQGQADAAKVLAKDLVRQRHQVKKFYKMKTQLTAVSLRLTTLKSTAALGGVMRSCATAMSRMNKSINLPKLQRIMMEFERQSEVMDMKDEMMQDTVDDIFDEEDESEEVDETLSAVFAEIGLDLDDKNKTGTTVGAQPVAVGVDADLESRLNSLRKN
ncbi:hypothetical protein PCE1_001064 [Barthelona sp. PCE]